MSTRYPHIELGRLIDLSEGRLSSAEHDHAQTHISECQACSERLSRVEKTIQLMRSDKSEDAPRYAIAAAASLIRRREPVTSGLRRVLASLRFDSLTAAPEFGTRAGMADERQVVFTAGENEIQLQIVPAEEKWKVYGQVLGPCVGGEVEVVGISDAMKAPLDDLCEFSLAPVPAGRYSLIFRLQDVELEVPVLELGT